MARRRSAAHLHLVAPLPQPAASLPEPVAPLPEPVAPLPEPADPLPEPVDSLPEPVEGPRRGQRPSLREPAQAPKPVEERKRELLAIISTKPWSCAACGEESGRGGFLTMDDAGPLCLDCADLGHLEFLPSGDAALTRRARKASRLSAVVVKWARARHRYERQGILIEVEAVEQAEQECLADHDLRERRRMRDAVHRMVEDEHFVAELAAAVREQFPGCPPKRADRIAAHAGSRSSGRIGRTSAGRALDPDAVRLAVIASVRHEDTRYEDLLMRGVERQEARSLVREDIDQVLETWSTAP